MEKILKYSVLRYSPSTVAGEKINLGIIFYDVVSGYREFKYLKKFNRLSTFDDEIDLSMVKKLLQSIEDDVSGNLFSLKFDIEEYTKYFVSDFSFDKPKLIQYDDLNDMIERLHKTYFRFEYDKAHRPSKAEDREIIKKIISSAGKTIKGDGYVIGACNEKIKYDIVTDDLCIKIFDFDDKNLNKLINSAKTWAWNAMYNKRNNVMIIYRYNEELSKYNDEFEIIMKIFKESQIRIYDIEEGMRILQGAS